MHTQGFINIYIYIKGFINKKMLMSTTADKMFTASSGKHKARIRYCLCSVAKFETYFTDDLENY